MLALAQAAGAAGMVGGQMIDLEAQHATLDLEAITKLQRLKTGAIIRFSCEAGAILGERAAEGAPCAAAPTPTISASPFRSPTTSWTSRAARPVTGKPVGQDQAAGKATFVAVLGVDEARPPRQGHRRSGCQPSGRLRGAGRTCSARWRSSWSTGARSWLETTRGVAAGSSNGGSMVSHGTRRPCRYDW